MKRILPTLLALLTLASAAQTALAEVGGGRKYRIVCSRYVDGGLTLGANHNSTALVYYDISATTSTEDAWWYIEPNGDGSTYTIQNVSSGQYLYYESTREDSVAKGIRLGTAADDDTYRWKFNAYSSTLYISNAAETDQYIDVRIDGTYLVGTYGARESIPANELFQIYDEDGFEITADDFLDEEEDDEPTDENQYGINANGEYWELTGLSQPVVFTTNTSNPVLYTITNVRRGQYLYVSGSNLLQTASFDKAGKFYFVKSSTSSQVNIYSESGEYVTTYDYSRSSTSTATTYVYAISGTTSTSSNRWAFSFYNDDTYPGYAIEKKTDTNTNTGRNYWNDYNGVNTCFYTLDGGSTYCFSSDDERHLDYLISQGLDFGGTLNRQTFASCVDSLRFDKKDLVYRQDTKTYMFNVRPKYRGGKTYTPNVEVVFRDPSLGYTLRIDSVPLSANNTIDLENVSGLRDYQLQVWSPADTIVAATTLNITFLPIVEVNVDGCNKNYYTKGSIRVNYFQNVGYDSTYIAAFKYRGATASGLSKKAYAVKIYDEAANKKDVEFLGLREDNSWILDAAAIDPSGMRNRVATDLWNEFSHEPYHKAMEKKARTGTRGKFVEVLLNGEYQGVYCMTEKMDRKQLKLAKVEAVNNGDTNDVVHGLLYKTKQWSFPVFFGHDQDDTDYSFPASSSPAAYTEGSETWQNIYLKYPDYSCEPTSWEPIFNAVNFVATSSDADFAANLSTYLDYPVLIDYYLFIELLLASDNHGKNMYYFNYDQEYNAVLAKKLGIAVWDLDGTFGIRWNGTTSLTYANQDFPTFLDANEHGQLSYYVRLQQSEKIDWTETLRERYFELRGGLFQEDTLCGRFDHYLQLLQLSGADTREQGRWSQYHNNIATAVSYADEWIRARLAYLDEQYGYDPETSGVETVNSQQSTINAQGGEGYISVNLPTAGHVDVYALGGQHLRSLDLPKGVHRISGIERGVYIVNGKKVLVK